MLSGYILYLYMKLRGWYEEVFLGKNYGTLKWFPFGLLLKMGESNIGHEADTLRYIRKHTTIPVPFVIASGIHGKHTYTLMEKVDGMLLEVIWPNLNNQQRFHVIDQLRGFMAQLQHLPPPPGITPGRIGSLYGRAFRDSRISNMDPLGPYPSESHFKDRLLEAADIFMDRGYSQPIMARMRNDHRIVFTHSDLTPRNIIMRGDTVAAIIDWEESGWLPEHWELVKARWSPQMPKDSGWIEALWDILGREQEEDWLLDCELSKYMVGGF